MKMTVKNYKAKRMITEIAQYSYLCRECYDEAEVYYKQERYQAFYCLDCAKELGLEIDEHDYNEHVKSIMDTAKQLAQESDELLEEYNRRYLKGRCYNPPGTPWMLAKMCYCAPFEEDEITEPNLVTLDELKRTKKMVADLEKLSNMIQIESSRCADQHLVFNLYIEDRLVVSEFVSNQDAETIESLLADYRK